MKQIDPKTLGKFVFGAIWIFYRMILHIFRIKPYPEDGGKE